MNNKKQNTVCQLFKDHLQRGQTLLEVAIIIPAALTIGLAALDLSSGLNAYMSIREGARTALRCVYTTDGLPGCNVSEAPILNPLYNVTVRQTDASYPYNVYSLSGSEHYLSAPLQQLSDFQARVLTEAEFQTESFRYSGDEIRIRAQGQTASQSILTAAYPRIDFTGPNVNDAVLSYAADTSQAYPAQQIGWGEESQVANGVSGIPTSRIVGRANFIVPSMTFGDECVVSSQLDFGPNAEHSPTTQPCDENAPYDQITGNIRAILSLKGRTAALGQNSDSGAFGNIDIRLRECTENNGLECVGSWVSAHPDLGGREYNPSSGDQDASLVPRGYNGVTQYIGLNPSNWSELSSHARIWLSPGKLYRIAATLSIADSSPDGAVLRYSGDGGAIYLPQFITNLGGVEECQGSFKPSEISSLTSCIGVSGRTLTNIQPVTPTQIDSRIPRDFGFRKTSNVPLSQLINSGENVIDFELSGVSPWQSSPQTQSCPSNTGVAGADDSDTLLNSGAAQSVCPITVQNVSDGPSAAEQTLTTFSHAYPYTTLNIDPVSWTRSSCEGDEIPQDLLPSELSEYAHTRVGSIEENGRDNLYLGSTVDPRELIESDSRYNCGVFTLVSKPHPTDEYREDELETGDYYHDEHHGVVCEEELATQARSEAYQELPIHADSYFEADATMLYTASGTIEQATDCDGSFPAPGDGGEILNEYTSGPHTREEANALPDCQLPNHYCQFTFIGFDGDGGNSLDIEHNFDTAAQAYGYSEVLAANPGARWNCEGHNCVRIDVEQNGEQIRASAAIDTRFFLLGGNTFTFNYQEQERWEGYMSR